MAPVNRRYTLIVPTMPSTFDGNRNGALSSQELATLERCGRPADGWTLLRACARSPLRHPASRHGFVAGDAAYHLDADHRPHLDRRGP
jgi:hypothetical protein